VGGDKSGGKDRERGRWRELIIKCDGETERGEVAGGEKDWRGGWRKSKGYSEGGGEGEGGREVCVVGSKSGEIQNVNT